jgi:hypothetical protein
LHLYKVVAVLLSGYHFPLLMGRMGQGTNLVLRLTSAVYCPPGPNDKTFTALSYEFS